MGCGSLSLMPRRLARRSLQHDDQLLISYYDFMSDVERPGRSRAAHIGNWAAVLFFGFWTVRSLAFGTFSLLKGEYANVGIALMFLPFNASLLYWSITRLRAKHGSPKDLEREAPPLQPG